VKLETTKGDLVIEVVRAWAPHGADRFYNLVRIGFLDDTAFFRVLDGFVAQFGLHGDSRVNGAWVNRTIPDDPRTQANARGTVSFAKTDSPDSRATQLFVNLGDNAKLDDLGFAPIGRVVEGMDVADALFAGYGDAAPRGEGPDQRSIVSLGNEYLKRRFHRLDWIKQATVLPQ
jgi:peptidyl-prolyl cis-trans isomerase A (cyclophilin A)